MASPAQLAVIRTVPGVLAPTDQRVLRRPGVPALIAGAGLGVVNVQVRVEGLVARLVALPQVVLLAADRFTKRSQAASFLLMR